MKKRIFLFSGLVLPAMGTEMPPFIPDGPVTYESVSYDDPLGGGYEDPFAYNNHVAPTPAPIAPVSSGDKNVFIRLNIFESNYQVRGMGVTNKLSDHGYTSLEADVVLPNRNLFNAGIYHKLGGTVGAVWGASEILGDTPVLQGHYALGKEIFPNLTIEAAYNVRHGGLEGHMALITDGCPHRLAQDVSVTLAFNDHQRGFFGHLQWGYGFQGLTGQYYDAEIGYRFTDVINKSSFGADLEVSVGASGSFGYWGAGVEGLDAGRVRFALPLYTHNGSLGRDGRWQFRPWVQFSATGSNAGKIDRAVGNGPVDHFQVTLGVEAGFSF